MDVIEFDANFSQVGTKTQMLRLSYCCLLLMKGSYSFPQRQHSQPYYYIMNIHTVAVLFVIGSTTPSVFSSDVAGRHRQTLQSKKASVGGNSNTYSPSSTAIDQCIKGFTGTYTYASECNGVVFMASLGCDDANQFCTYTESQFADMTVSVCPNRGPRPPSDCVVSGSFAATEHVDPRTCEVKVFKVSGDENCNFQEFAATPTGIRITRDIFHDDELFGIYFERMDNDPKILSSTKDDLNARRLDKKSVGVLYSKSVDDHHRYLANGDVTTEDKMKVLDVHRRRLECSGDDCDVDSIATCNPNNDCACAPTNGWCRSFATVFGVVACLPPRIPFGVTGTHLRL